MAMQPVTLTRDQARGIISDHQVSDAVVLIGIRDKTNNRINVYDDTLAILTPTGFTAVNGNVDPSVNRPGIATLQPGVYKYKIGIHGIHHLDLEHSAADKAIYDLMLKTGEDPKHIEGRILPYWAFRQAGPVKLLRGGKTAPEMDGWPADPAWIDIHCGGYNTTSSEGCQTVFPDFWPHFRSFGFAAMREANQEYVQYILI